MIDSSRLSLVPVVALDLSDEFAHFAESRPPERYDKMIRWRHEKREVPVHMTELPAALVYVVSWRKVHLYFMWTFSADFVANVKGIASSAKSLRISAIV